MNYIIYQVHGNIAYYHEALYSILSYYMFNINSEIKIVIYTDNATFLKKYLPNDVIYISITDKKIIEWRGEIDFVHRVKIKIIQDFTSKYNGNFLYLDTDTSFTSNINDIFDSIENDMLFFDKYECELFESKSLIIKRIARFFKRNNLQKSHSELNLIEVAKPFYLWNAGAIGFNTKYISLLNNVEALTDLLYPKLKSHITEQFAFCYYFQTIKRPQVTDGKIYHYWDFKEFRPILKEFFDYNSSKNLLELIAEIDKIDPIILSKDKVDYRKMTFFGKIVKRILNKGKKWENAPYKL